MRKIILFLIFFASSAFADTNTIAYKSSDQIVFKTGHYPLNTTFGSVKKDKVQEYATVARDYCSQFRKNVYLFSKSFFFDNSNDLDGRLRFFCSNDDQDAIYLYTQANRMADWKSILEIYSSLPLKFYKWERTTLAEEMREEQEKKEALAKKKEKEKADRLAKQKKEEEEKKKQLALSKEKEKEEAEKKEREKKEAEQREITRLEKAYGPSCKGGFFTKGYEKGTKEWIDCLKRKENEVIAESNKQKLEAERKEKEKEEIRQKIIARNKSKTPENINNNKDFKPSNYDELKIIGIASGFFITNKGYVITNDHAIKKCLAIQANIKGEKKFFNIISKDEINDLALLKGNFTSKDYLKIKKTGPSLGENIFVFGYPLSKYTGAGVKITEGIVSSLSGPKNNVSRIQISAAIHPGSSGGPVVNKNGDVVGVAVAGISKNLVFEKDNYMPENINFAVSSIPLNVFIKQYDLDAESSFFKKNYDSQELAKIGDKATVRLFCLNTVENWERLKSERKYSNILLDTLE